MNITFVVEKQTKNTIRFSEKENDLSPAPAIGTLYVQKWAVAELLKKVGQPANPSETVELKVTVEVNNG